ERDRGDHGRRPLRRRRAQPAGGGCRGGLRRHDRRQRGVPRRTAAGRAHQETPQSKRATPEPAQVGRAPARRARRRADRARSFHPGRTDGRDAELGRFIPGGRTAVTLSAGMLPFRWRAFVVFDALAALGWALYASMLGFFGGEAFEKAPWKGLVVAIGIAFSTAAAIELVRWYRHRRATTGERMPPADDRRDGR